MKGPPRGPSEWTPRARARLVPPPPRRPGPTSRSPDGGRWSTTLPLLGTSLTVGVSLGPTGGISGVTLTPTGALSQMSSSATIVRFSNADGSATLKVRAAGSSLSVGARTKTLASLVGNGTWKGDVFGTGSPSTVAYTIGDDGSGKPTLAIGAINAGAGITATVDAPKTKTARKWSTAWAGVTFAREGFVKHLAITVTVKLADSSASLAVTLSGKDRQRLEGTLAGHTGSRRGQRTCATARPSRVRLPRHGRRRRVVFDLRTGAPFTVKDWPGGKGWRHGWFNVGGDKSPGSAAASSTGSSTASRRSRVGLAGAPRPAGRRHVPRSWPRELRELPRPAWSRRATRRPPRRDRRCVRRRDRAWGKRFSAASGGHRAADGTGRALRPAGGRGPGPTDEGRARLAAGRPPSGALSVALLLLLLAWPSPPAAARAAARWSPPGRPRPRRHPADRPLGPRWHRVIPRPGSRRAFAALAPGVPLRVHGHRGRRSRHDRHWSRPRPRRRDGRRRREHDRHLPGRASEGMGPARRRSVDGARRRRAGRRSPRRPAGSAGRGGAGR